MANWYQIGPLLTRFTNAYIGAPPGGDDGPTGFRAGDPISNDMVDNNPFVIGVGTKITSGEWVRYAFPYNYKLIKGMPAFIYNRDVCFIWTVSLEFTIPGTAGTVIRKLPPVPPVTETPKTPVASIYNTTGRVIPYSKGFRRLQGAKIWLQGIEGGAQALVDTAYGTWAESFGYPLHPGEDIFVQTIWFDGNKVWDKDDGFLIDGAEFTFTFYSGTETQTPDPNIVLDKGANRTPAFRGQIYIVFLNVPLATFSNRIPSTTTIELQPTDQERITIAGAIEDVGVLGEVALTVEGIDNEADGVVFANGLNPRSILQTYADQYDYRIIDGSPIRVVRRGLNDDFAIDLELTADDFGSKDAADEIVTPKRADASSLPNQVELTYIDLSQNYQQGTQYARRPIFPVPAVTASGVQTISTEFIITAVEAISIAYDLLYRLWARQLTAPFTLIAQRSEVEEGDVLSVPTSQGTFVMEVVRRSLSPDDTTTVEARYLLSANGAALTADAGDANVNPLRKPYPYPGILSSLSIGVGAFATGDFPILNDPWGFILSDGNIVAVAPQHGEPPAGVVLQASPLMLTIAPPTIPSTISARNAIDIGVFASAVNGQICEDASYWYTVGIVAPDSLTFSVVRVSKADHSTSILHSGIAMSPDFVAAANGKMFVLTGATGSGSYTSGDEVPPPRLAIIDLATFSADDIDLIYLYGLDLATAGHYSGGTGLAIAAGYVIIAGIAYVRAFFDDPLSVVDQRLWRYSIADGTVDSQPLTAALAAGVGSDGVAFFLPFTQAGVNDTGHTTGAIVDAASFAISYIDLADDDPNVIHIHQASKPWVDDDRFYFLANNGAQTAQTSISTINAPYLSKRTRDGASDGGVDLTFYYDNVAFKLDVGVCDDNFHYIHGAVYNALPYRGGGCILRLAKDASYATFYPARQAPPANDSFAKATPLKAGVAAVNYNTEFATSETGEPDHSSSSSEQSVWFQFTPTISQTYTIEVAGNANVTPWKAEDGTIFFSGGRGPVAVVYRGASLSALNQVWANLQQLDRLSGSEGLAGADGLPVYVGGSGAHPLPPSFHGEAGVTYHIAIDAYYNRFDLTKAYGPGTIKITGAATATNDDFDDAIEIAVGETKTGDNTFASKQTGEPDHGGNAGGKSLWWTFTATNDHTIRITTDDSDVPTAIGVYTGSSVDDLTEIASVADATNPTDDDWTSWSITR